MIINSRRIASTLVVAFAVAGCGVVDGDNPRAGGEVLDGGLDGLALPVTAVYGYLDLTVASAEATPEAPAGIAVEAPVATPTGAAAAYLAVEVEIANPVDESGFTIPPELFQFATGGERYSGAVEGGEDITVDPESTTTSTVWFVLPPDAVIADPVLMVRETNYQPLSIPLAEGSTTPEQVPVTMEGDYESECYVVKFGDGFASFNAGVTALGNRRPAPNASNLGRAAEGEALISFDVVATERCSSVVTFFSVNAGPNGVIREARVGDRPLVPTTASDDLSHLNDVTVDGHLTFAVPADATEPLEIDWEAWIDETATGHTSASLDGIAALTGA